MINKYRRLAAQTLNSVRANPGSILMAAGVAATLATPAHAQGLSTAKSTLEKIKTEILGVVPILAVIALILIGLAYAFKLAEKEVLVRWTAGVIIVGAASGIVDMLVKTS